MLCKYDRSQYSFGRSFNEALFRVGVLWFESRRQLKVHPSFDPDVNMLGVSNLYLCVLSVFFTITDGLVGEIPFEELHF